MGCSRDREQQGIGAAVDQEVVACAGTLLNASLCSQGQSEGHSNRMVTLPCIWRLGNWGIECNRETP